MKLDYTTLRNYAINGDRIGNYKGKPVLALSERDLKNVGTEAYYIIYDDENPQDSQGWPLVKKGWDYSEIVAFVQEDGDVEEIKPIKFITAWGIERRRKKEIKVKVPDPVVGDVKLEIDVDATLKGARKMTIDKLLEGFNYGLG